jgi:hypothetical protein
LPELALLALIFTLLVELELPPQATSSSAVVPTAATTRLRRSPLMRSPPGGWSAT